MIVELFINLVCDLVIFLFSFLNFISLPLDFIEVLATFTRYGSFIVGSDLLLVIIGIFCGFVTVRLVAGLALKLWDMLPFT